MLRLGLLEKVHTATVRTFVASETDKVLAELPN